MESTGPSWCHGFEPNPDESLWSVPAQAFQGFHLLTANFTQLPNEVLELKLPELTMELRWTLVMLTRETVGEAYRRGVSPYSFLAISWSRWMVLLELGSINAVKARLARLEAMGLIEVLPGERGAWGTTANRYRLRWRDVGDASSRAFRATLHDRSRQLLRKREARAGGYPPADTPSSPRYQPADTPPAATPGVSVQADPPSIEQTDNPGTTIFKNSVSPSVPHKADRTDRPTEGSTLDLGPAPFDWRPWLREPDPEPWPEALVKELGETLSRTQAIGIEETSPWSAEGAWAILQGIRSKGSRLAFQAGTLWNALVKPEKGARWLAEAGPPLRYAGWRMVPEDELGTANCVRNLLGKNLNRQGFSRLPLDDETQARLRDQRAKSLNQTQDPISPDDGPDVEELMATQDPANPTQEEVQPTRPEELDPGLQAALRASIETFRQASRAAYRSPRIHQPGFFQACSDAYRAIGDLLEPLLPIQVAPPEVGGLVIVRHRGQIKVNVLNAIYRAIS